MFIEEEELKNILNIMDELNQLRDSIYTQYLKELEKYNYNRMRVDHIISAEGKGIDSYEDVLSIHKDICHSAHNIITLEKNLDVSQCRIKEPKSIHGKLERYRKRSEQGKVALHKCLNDLLGVRIICETFQSSEIHKLKSLLEQKAENMHIKILNQTKDTYIGLHVYFMLTKNKILPWELQIWSQSDREQNEESHEIYKKYYSNT